MNVKENRNEKIRSLYFTGQYTMREIGERYKVTVQRIQQIIHPHPLRIRKCSCSEPFWIDGFCLVCFRDTPPAPPPPPDPQDCCVCGRKFIGKKRGKYPLCPEHSQEDFYAMEGRDKMRELVRIRDGHTCQECGEKWERGQRKLDVHHLKDEDGSFTRKYDTLDSLNDMVTLCHRCHMNLPSEKRKMLRGKGII